MIKSLEFIRDTTFPEESNICPLVLDEDGRSVYRHLTMKIVWNSEVVSFADIMKDDSGSKYEDEFWKEFRNLFNKKMFEEMEKYHDRNEV